MSHIKPQIFNKNHACYIKQKMHRRRYILIKDISPESKFFIKHTVCHMLFWPYFHLMQSWSASRRTLLGGEDHKVVTSPTIYMIRPVGMSPTSNLNSVIFMINGSQSNDNPKTFLIAIFIASIIFSLSTGIFFFDWILIFSNHLIYLLELKNLWDRVPIKVHLRDMLHMYHYNVKMMGSKLDHM